MKEREGKEKKRKHVNRIKLPEEESPQKNFDPQLFEKQKEKRRKTPGHALRCHASFVPRIIKNN